MKRCLQEIRDMFEGCMAIEEKDVYSQKASASYRDWYLASCEFFCEEIGDGDRDYRLFIEWGDNSGEGINLKLNFEKLAPLFVVLAKKVEMKSEREGEKG